jgi:hypothetical protein
VILNDELQKMLKEVITALAEVTSCGLRDNYEKLQSGQSLEARVEPRISHIYI